MMKKVQDLMTTFLNKYEVGIEILVAALIYSDRISSISFTEKIISESDYFAMLSRIKNLIAKKYAQIGQIVILESNIRKYIP